MTRDIQGTKLKHENLWSWWFLTNIFKNLLCKNTFDHFHRNINHYIGFRNMFSLNIFSSFVQKDKVRAFEFWRFWRAVFAAYFLFKSQFCIFTVVRFVAFFFEVCSNLLAKTAIMYQRSYRLLFSSISLCERAFENLWNGCFKIWNFCSENII